MISRNLAGVSLLAALLLGGVGLSACAIENPQPNALVETSEAIDAALNDKVEKLLRADAGLTGSRLSVRGGGGIVTIGGTVPDEHSLRRALDLASGVRGVREIRNAMELGFPK